MMDDPLPPTALESEGAILSASIWAADAYREASKLISDDDWYVPVHADIWKVLRKFEADGIPIEATAVGVEVSKLGTNHARIISELVTQSGTTAGSVGWHCERVTEASTARQYQVVLRRSWQRATTPGTQASTVELAEETIEQLRAVQSQGALDEAGAVDVLDLIVRPDTADDWVLPDLLARGDRFVLTAPEGYGKSTLLRQLAVCAAAGLHPFKAEGIEPRRVLVYDCENPEKINRHEYRNLLGYFEHIGQMPARGQLHIDIVGSTNLLDPREAARLYTAVDNLRPDLIVIGPIYQLHEGNPNDEEPAKKVSRVLDRARMLHNSALITEAHTPHNDGPHGQLLRPYGASLWKRWPEFGYCLHEAEGVDRKAKGEQGFINRTMRESELTPWRGPRQARKWPSRLSAGQRLPWEEHY